MTTIDAPASPARPNLMILIGLAGISAFTMSVILPALPSMAAHYGVDYAVMQLAVSLYFAFTGVLQLILGPLSDRYGRRPVLLFSIGGFTLASLFCTVAPTAGWLLAGRLAQGVVVSAMVLSRTIIRDTTSPEKAASLIGYVTMGMAVGPMLAPAIGGFLGETFGWQSIFLFTAAVGGTLWASCLVGLNETHVNRTGGFAKMRADAPALIRSRRFWGYVFTSGLAAGTYFAYLGGAPIIAVRIYGLGQTETGLFLGLISFGYIFGNYISGRFGGHWGSRVMLSAGTVVATAGIVAAAGMVALGATHPIAFFGLMISVGLGNGMTLPSATVGLMNVRPSLAGTASGIGGAITIMGGGALSAATGIIGQWGENALPLAAFLFVVSLGSLLAAQYTLKVEREFD